MVSLNLPEEVLLKIAGILQSKTVEFLGYTIDLQKGQVADTLGSNPQDIDNLTIYIIATLLSHYTSAKQVPPTGKLVKFRDLQGGCAYEKAFLQRAVQPVAEAFGKEPQKLLEAAKRLGGNALSYGDASAEITTLPAIPLTIIVWATEEFPTTANILYDQTANNHLPTEDLAVLGELAASRLIKAQH